MAKVVAPEGFALELDSERMTFGHSEEIEVPLQPDLGIAERHFSIVRFGQKHFIEHMGDRSSSTLVNGSPISKQSLEDGDEIAAGELVLTFHCDDDGLGSGDNLLPEAELPVGLKDLFNEDNGEAEPAPSAPVKKPPLFDAPAAESAPSLESAPPLESETSPAFDLPKPSVLADTPPAPRAAPVNQETAPPQTPTSLPKLPKPELPVAIPAAPPVAAKPTAAPPAATPPAAAPPAAAPPAAAPPAASPPAAASPVPAPPVKEEPRTATASAQKPELESAPIAQVESPVKPEAAALSLPQPAPAIDEKSTEPQEPASLPTLKETAPAESTEVEPAAPLIVTALDEPPIKKPGRETQRIKLASAISSALTPRAPVAPSEPNIAPPTNVEQLEVQAQAQATPTAPAQPSTALPAQGSPPETTSSTALPVPVAAPASSQKPISSTLPTPATPVAAAQSIPSLPAPSAPASVSAIQPTAAPLAQTATPSPPVTPAEPAPTAAPDQVTPPEPEPEAKVETPKRKKKAAKPPKKKKTRIKRPRKPLFPFLRVFIPGLITLGLVGAGGYYAWENHFKPEKKPKEFLSDNKQSAGFPSASVNVQDVLRFLPNDAEIGAFVDVRTAYSMWSGAMNPSGEPIYNPIDDFVFESTGVGLNQLEFLCIAGAADTANDFVAIAGFGADLNPAQVFDGIEQTGSRLIRLETINEVPLRIMEREGKEFELVLVDPRTILVTSVGKMRSVLESSKRSTPNFGPVTASLGKFISDDAAFALTGTPAALDIGNQFELFGCPASPELLEQIDSMETVSISALANKGLELTISFSASDPLLAAKATPIGTAWLATAPQDVRDRYREDFPDAPLPGALDRVLQTAEWATARNVNRIRLQIPRRDINSLLSSILSDKQPAEMKDQLARKDAEDFVSIFQSATFGGNPDLPKAGSVEKAIEMLIDGVRGRDGFSETEFRHPTPPSKAELPAVARQLKWENGALILRGKAK